MAQQNVQVPARIRTAAGQTPFKNLLLHPQTGILIFLLVLVVFFSFAAAPYFFTVNNALNIVRQSSVLAIVAFGMTFVILTGGIDLSVGSVAGAAAIIGGVVNIATQSVALAVGAALGFGLIVGAFSGAVIVFTRIPDFIATLAMLSIIRGGSLVVTEAKSIFGFTPAYYFIGQGRIGPVPFSIILAATVFAVSFAALHFTKFGRHVYAVGGNREVARLSGVNVSLIRVAVYTISGLYAALAGVLLSSRTAAATPTTGQLMELDAIAAVVLGGTNLFGGRGAIAGTFIGVGILFVLSNGLVMVGINPFYVTVVKGTILLIAVIVSTRR